MKKIKILQTIRQGKIGGGESHVLELCTNMDKSKFESVVLSFTPGPMVDELNRKGIKTKVIHTEKPFDFRSWKKVKDFMHREQFDICPCPWNKSQLKCILGCKKVKTSFNLHGSWLVVSP